MGRPVVITWARSNPLLSLHPTQPPSNVAFKRRSWHHQNHKAGIGIQIFPLGSRWGVWCFAPKIKRSSLWKYGLKLLDDKLKLRFEVWVKAWNIGFKIYVQNVKKIPSLLVWQCEIWFFLSVTFCCNFCSSLDTEWRPSWWGSRRQLGLTWKGNCLLLRTFPPPKGVLYLAIIKAGQ